MLASRTSNSRSGAVNRPFLTICIAIAQEFWSKKINVRSFLGRFGVASRQAPGTRAVQTVVGGYGMSLRGGAAAPKAGIDVAAALQQLTD
jgi:hypothetical protein